MKSAVLFGGGIDAYPAAALFRNLLRLTIRAIEEYQEAVKKIVGAIEYGAVSNLTFASSNWESCIETTYRAVNIAEALRITLGKWAPDDNNIRIEKSTRFTDAELKPLKDLRDACQHIEERMGKFIPYPDNNGRSIYVYSGQLSIHFEGFEISYDKIAELLSRLVLLGQWLNMQNPPLGHPLSALDKTTEITFTNSALYQKSFDGKQPN